MSAIPPEPSWPRAVAAAPVRGEASRWTRRRVAYPWLSVTRRVTRNRAPRARFGLSALLVATVGVGVGGCGAVAKPSPVRRAIPAPRTIVIPVRMRWSVFGARPMIHVRVGKGPAVPVLLDTGSTGLHIYTRGVALGARSGVAVTAQPDAVTYADGTTQRGVVARARLTIGQLKTTRPVAFGLIDKVGCVPQIHFCPGSGGIKGFVSAGEYGILGIGLRRSPDRTENPLLALPAVSRITRTPQV